MSILDTIPTERLALLDTATLYRGVHYGGRPDCRHCARELLHEVVTGKHADKTPPGVTEFVSILPYLNDAWEWRNDAHRTTVLRPYLRRLLSLDPTHDSKRVWALVDRACTHGLYYDAGRGIDLVADLMLDLIRGRYHNQKSRAKVWEQEVREVLDLICGIE